MQSISGQIDIHITLDDIQIQIQSHSFGSILHIQIHSNNNGDDDDDDDDDYNNNNNNDDNNNNDNNNNDNDINNNTQ